MHFFSRIGALALAFSLFAACAGGTTPPALRGPTAVQSAVQTSRGIVYGVHPKLRRLTDLLLHNCTGAAGSDCLTPSTVRTAYNYSYTAGVNDGTGQTIVIVDAYGSPTMKPSSDPGFAKSDLHVFDQMFSIPDPPSFSIVYPGGKPNVNLSSAKELGWAEETSLDVEWAHASAPGANIVLIVSNNDQGDAVQSAQQYSVATYPGSIMSLSFGLQESSINGGANNTQISDAVQIYRQAAAAGITVLAASGDLGATGGFALPNPQYPASDPNVLAVGGTDLTLFNNGRYRSEAVWQDATGSSGGAPSLIFNSANDTTTPYRYKVLYGTVGPNQSRGVSDVAYSASPLSGVVVYIGFTGSGVTPGKYDVGGTSQGPPRFAGILAIANELRKSNAAPLNAPLGSVANLLYCLYYNGVQTSTTPPFHDVAHGSNVFPAGAAGYSAGTGYDFPTGLGTPNINNLLSLLKTPPAACQ